MDAAARQLFPGISNDQLEEAKELADDQIVGDILKREERGNEESDEEPASVIRGGLFAVGVFLAVPKVSAPEATDADRG